MEEPLVNTSGKQQLSFAGSSTKKITTNTIFKSILSEQMMYFTFGNSGTGNACNQQENEKHFYVLFLSSAHVSSLQNV